MERVRRRTLFWVTLAHDMVRACPQCGFSNDATKPFCAQCGSAMGPPPPVVASEPRLSGGKTVLGMSASDFTPPAPPSAGAAGPSDPSQAQGQAHGAGRGLNRTVLGMAGIASPAAPLAPSEGIAPPAAALPIPQTSANKTMLGVAVPGIAPLNPGGAPAAPITNAANDGPMPASARGRVNVANENRTMMGVPAPGATPAARQPSLLTNFPIVPPPAQLALDPIPEPPKKVARRGVPLGLLAGGLAGLVLCIGVAAVLLLKTSSPLVVQPRLSPKGADVLHLTCDSCPDGTHVTLDAAKADFTAKEADLELPTPLRVGENALVLHLDRPAMGRDEEVKAAVPVNYRIRTDLTSISDAAPTLKIAVDAVPGAVVNVDGKPLALDASGKAVYPIDLSADTAGMADETRTIEKTIPYDVTLNARTEKGTVVGRVGVPALRIDAPLSKTVIGADRFFVAGRTNKGATVTVNGRPVAVDATGVFAEPFGAPTPAEIAIEVRAIMPSSAPRTVTQKLRRSDALEAQARSADKAITTTIPYADLVRDISSAVGKPRAVEGDLVELRVTNHQSVLLVRDKRACDKPDGGCLVRVVFGAELDLKPGTKVLAVGRVTRAITAGANTVPEIEADFVLPAAGSAKR